MNFYVNQEQKRQYLFQGIFLGLFPGTLVTALNPLLPGVWAMAAGVAVPLLLWAGAALLFRTPLFARIIIAVVCAMGDSSKDAAIICTALLRQMGCPFIIARAGSATCRRILFMVGAHEVIFPEQDYGQRFATWLMHRELLASTDWNGELSLSEIKPPKFMIGKNLVELALPRKFGVIVAAVRRNGKLLRPDPELPVEPEDVLFIVADETAIKKLSEAL